MAKYKALTGSAVKGLTGAPHDKSIGVEYTSMFNGGAKRYFGGLSPEPMALAPTVLHMYWQFLTYFFTNFTLVMCCVLPAT